MTVEPYPIPPAHESLARAERTDPVQPRWFDLVADACLGQHAAVADQHHPKQSETAPELVDLHAHGGRVGGVAVEHLDRHRTPLGVAQQAELDLQLAALGVARMTVFGQRAAAPFQVHRGQVIEHQCTVVEVALGQASLNGVHIHRIYCGDLSWPCGE